MEDINIILSIIDEYKHQLKDNDYKICMETLMKIYKKKIDNKKFHEQLLKNSDKENFIKINNKQFIHNEGYNYIFDENEIYDYLFNKYFIITEDDVDIINSNIISWKINIAVNKLPDYMRVYRGIKKIIYTEKKKHGYSGIKLRQ